jgi:putative lipoic acid-binding regulatory protein
MDQNFDLKNSPEVFDFPCVISLKAIGDDREDYAQFVIDSVRSVIGELDTSVISTRKSQQSNFISVTVPFTAQDREQLESVYRVLKEDARTRYLI